MTRTDTHSPKSFDPAEYDEVGYFDNHPEEGGCWIDPEVRDKSDFEGNYLEKGRCDHCGAGPLRYGVVFLHRPSDTLVTVGTICAGRLGLKTRSEYDRKRLLAQAVRAAHRARFAASLDAEQAAAIAWMGEVAEAYWHSEDFPTRFPGVSAGTAEFLGDLHNKLGRYGDLSEKQLAAIVKIKARAAEIVAKREAEAEALKDAPPLAEGRLDVEGEILTTKWQDNAYGGALKMLVKMDDGNKVWGTVPGAIDDAVWSEYREAGERREDVDTGTLLKGRRVRFTATVERSRDDEHFGFYKRPSKPALIKGEGA